MVNLSFLAPTFAFLGNSGRTSTTTRRTRALDCHSSVVSPYSTTAIATATIDPESPSDSSLQDICELLGVTPLDSIRLESTPDDGVRGVYLNHNVQEGDFILKVPLQSCLLDDEPPQWWSRLKEDQKNDPENIDENFLAYAYNNLSEWAPRLAASLLELQLNPTHNKRGQQLWLEYLPDENQLRASLPVHWPEEILSSARCTALELAVDSAYFARAEAVSDLVQGLRDYSPYVPGWSFSELQTLAQNALDVVQTRSCRVERWQLPLRVLAPVFDLINHGSSSASGEGSANAAFGLEDDRYLCVRATKPLQADEEVLIDYGDSTKPAWKCLLNYGFVPQYRLPHDDDEEVEDEDENNEDDNVAELYLDGHRYEVGPSTIPVEMVSAVCAQQNNNAKDDDCQVELTPDIAKHLARRISEVSMYLLLDDKEKQKQQQESAAGAGAAAAEEDEDEYFLENLEELISLKGAASLRWSHHRILQACANGLLEWASE
jgi:SET domain